MHEAIRLETCGKPWVDMPEVRSRKCAVVQPLPMRSVAKRSFQGDMLMTPADHAALSAQLARALGYYPESVWVNDYFCYVFRNAWFDKETWCRFDYRDPSVAIPVLEWFGVHHSLNVWSPERGGWSWSTGEGFDGHCGTLHEAIARAAIAVPDDGLEWVEQNEAREVLQP